MKKDRNCMYPTYQMPYMPVNMPYMPLPNMDTTDYNSLSNQVKALERRISNLEAIIGGNNYNNSSYQMM